MAPKRRMEKTQPRGAPNSMHPPPDQRAVGSPQALTPLWSCHNRWFDSPTGQSGGYATGTEHTIAHAAGDATTTQSEIHTTHGVDAHTDPRCSCLLGGDDEEHPADDELTGIGIEEVDPSSEDTPRRTTGPMTQHHRSGECLEAPTEPLAQYQLAGEGQMSHITDAAQLTHLLSRADDVDMLSAPATPRANTHDIATSRRRIGGRCRKWAVSTQTASQSNKRKGATCTMCGQQFTAGEPRLQQWANRSTQRHYVRAKSVTGGNDQDHELVPKVPGDHGARDTLIRLRNSVLSPAAGAAEVVLPIHGPHDDNSTEAPRRRRPIVRQGGGIAPR